MYIILFLFFLNTLFDLFGPGIVELKISLVVATSLFFILKICSIYQQNWIKILESTDQIQRLEVEYLELFNKMNYEGNFKHNIIEKLKLDEIDFGDIRERLKKIGEMQRFFGNAIVVKKNILNFVAEMANISKILENANNCIFLINLATISQKK